MIGVDGSVAERSIAFVGPKSSVFVTRTAEALEQRGFHIEIIDPGEGDPPRVLVLLGRIGLAAGRFLHARRVIGRTRAPRLAVVHGLGPDLIWLVPLLKRRFQRVVGIAYGSDILRRKHNRDWALGPALGKLDHISATNDHVVEAIVAGFPRIARDTLSVIRFGLPVLEALEALGDSSDQRAAAKTALGLDPDKWLVSLGYSASPGQRQAELIQHFTVRPPGPHIKFLVPIQYGDSTVIQRVMSACEQANLALGREVFRPLTTFFDVAQSASLRLATDVLVNHSTSDAFSGTVVETSFAGNLVMAASHLPYRTMPGAGSSVHFYDDLTQLSTLLDRPSLEAKQAAAQRAMAATREGISKFASWPGVLPQWHRLLGGPVNGAIADEA
jgi:hypothetical protein